MTVCQLMAFRLREVAQKPKMKTARPNKLTARFALVLSALSAPTKVPTSMTATVPAAPKGSRAFSGII
jgi:hypothetical protein